MPREKSTSIKNLKKAAEHSAKKRRVEHGNRHQIFELSQLKRTVIDAQIGDTITLQTDNQEGVKIWRVKMGQKPNGKFGKIAKLVAIYDYDYDDSDKTASEGSPGNSSSGGKSRRRKSRKSRKTRKSFYNWS